MTDALYLAELGEVRLGDDIAVGGDEGHHAAVVKRTRVGESVLVADGAGRAIRGPVSEVTKKGLVVQVAELLTEPVTAHRWTAVQALAKGERAEIAVATLTELGATHIVAWQAARSVVRWAAKEEKGLAKWQATARESTKQSRRYRVPKIDYASTAQVCQLIGAADLALVAHEEADLPLARVGLPVGGEVVVIVGPEGGITAQELALFTAAGAQLVSLGNGVLRASSAGVVALAQLQALAELQSATFSADEI